VPGNEAFSGFDGLLNQRQPISKLSAILAKGSIPHAMLFTGIDGIGKLTIANIFAMSCNCSEVGREYSGNIDETHNTLRGQKVSNPCGKCRSCSKILSGNHPDIINIEPSGLIIKIIQIRELCNSLILKPYEAQFRFVLISDAHKMNKEAGNALLKILEEPPERTVFVLTATHTSDLLPTIVSRCQQIRFNPVSRKNIEKILIDNHGISEDEAFTAASMANGSLARALSIASGKVGRISLNNWRKWLVNEVEILPSRSMSSILAFAEKITEKKTYISDTLEILKTYLRDILIYRYSPEIIINIDLASRIKSFSQKTTIESIVSKIEAVQEAQQSITANANLKLTLELMVMRLAKPIG
jgi:DNA polymerase-3 subunit delta'